MPPVLLASPDEIPSAELDDWGDVEKPYGDLVARRFGRMLIPVGKEGFKVGLWECTPGRWRRTIMDAEFAHFLSGKARFVPDEGEPIDIKGGDTIWFPANSKGVWEISETCRKTYVVFATGGWMRSVRTFLGSLKLQLGKRGPAGGHPGELPQPAFAIKASSAHVAARSAVSQGEVSRVA